MAVTYEPIQSIVLASDTAVSGVAFNSIPATYTDLVLVFHGAFTAGTGVQNFGMRFNGDAGTNYSHQRNLGDGTSPSGERQTNISRATIGDVGSNKCIIVANIFNYTNTNIHKPVIANGGEATYLWNYASMWRSTTAINSITFNGSGSTFASGSTFTLYGIKAAA